jgi:hypothetical protein
VTLGNVREILANPSRVSGRNVFKEIKEIKRNRILASKTLVKKETDKSEGIHKQGNNSAPI